MSHFFQEREMQANENLLEKMHQTFREPNPASRVSLSHENQESRGPMKLHHPRQKVSIANLKATFVIQVSNMRC